MFLMKCKQCGKEMNPVDSLISSTHRICGNCTRQNQKKTTGEKRAIH